MTKVAVLKFPQKRCLAKNWQNSPENICKFVKIEKNLRYRCFPVNFAKFCRTQLRTEHSQVTLFKMSKDALEKCFLP